MKLCLLAVIDVRDDLWILVKLLSEMRTCFLGALIAAVVAVATVFKLNQISD